MAFIFTHFGGVLEVGQNLQNSPWPTPTPTPKRQKMRRVETAPHPKPTHTPKQPHAKETLNAKLDKLSLKILCNVWIS